MEDSSVVKVQQLQILYGRRCPLDPGAAEFRRLIFTESNFRGVEVVERQSRRRIFPRRRRI